MYYKSGSLDNKCIWYYDNGNTAKERNYKDGKFHGKWIYYFENKKGRIEKEENYKYGKLDGKKLFYHSTGLITKEVNYKNGVYDGNIIEYYKDYNFFSVRYICNLYTVYDMTNNPEKEKIILPIKLEGYYQDGKKDGKWIYYYLNGEIKREEYYNGGKEDGKWIWYKEDGKIDRIENYKAGQFIGTR